MSFVEGINQRFHKSIKIFGQDTTHDIYLNSPKSSGIGLRATDDLIISSTTHDNIPIFRPLSVASSQMSAFQHRPESVFFFKPAKRPVTYFHALFEVWNTTSNRFSELFGFDYRPATHLFAWVAISELLCYLVNENRPVPPIFEPYSGIEAALASMC